MLPKNYLDKVYGGFLGKCIGIRLGAPVEPVLWDFERIKKTYGYVDYYVKPYKNFAADDDSNGPAYFIRALVDDAKDRELTAQDVAKTWLNYAREGVGMFWWGGYGISTEHTAYTNLKMGITAPQSGSIAQNGETIAEQIGGQIFIDTFGLVNPCNVKKAADYGEIAASVSHDGEGLLGARFFCAAIAKAFETSNIDEIISAGISQIPDTSIYYAVTKAVIDFYWQHPKNFEDCMKMLEENWGYDKFPGDCHIIPNTGICILAMMYGRGDFCKTVEIACTCGWDTDCNAGNVGTVLGVAYGVESFPKKYREPINDGIILSGISGYLNIMDLPTFSKEIALLGYRLAGEAASTILTDAFTPGNINFDFELPGSTHNIRVSDPYLCQARHSTEIACSGTGSLEILFSKLSRSVECKVFYKPFYTRDDFSDERYMPAFSPQAVSGQEVTFSVYLDQWDGLDLVGVNPYIHTINGTEIVIKTMRPQQQEWSTIEFIIPDTKGEIIDEVGFMLEGLSSPKSQSRGRIFLDDFKISGKADYSIDFTKQRKNFGCITPFVHSDGAWRIEGDKVNSVRCKPSFSYTGNYYAKDQSISAVIVPFSGNDHLLAVRCGGIMRGYFAGLTANNTVSILCNNFGYTAIATAKFMWDYKTTYKLELTAIGDKIILAIDGKNLLEIIDTSHTYGMVGFGATEMGRTTYSQVHITNGVI